MTERKDFKRVVRARARRTGESYSSALRNVRTSNDRPAAAGGAVPSKEGLPVSIIRALPEIRSTNVDKTLLFYRDLLGFGLRQDGDRVVAFTSTTHPGVEVLLNPDRFSLPPGFTIEVATSTDVRALEDRASDFGVRVLADRSSTSDSLSVLDPSGRRITVTEASAEPVSPVGVGTRLPVTRVLPGVTTNDLASTRRFYVDYLGFVELAAVNGVSLFRAPDSPAQLIGSTTVGASPDGFDIDVGTVERVEQIYAEAKGSWMQLGAPQDFPEHRIRCFTVFDPNGYSVNVAAHLGS
jgi:catechol 2,3-dioxygenase-like lactoylglutathione lyase family enzyme